jgi:hypothetical protein
MHQNAPADAHGYGRLKFNSSDRTSFDNDPVHNHETFFAMAALRQAIK